MVDSIRYILVMSMAVSCFAGCVNADAPRQKTDEVSARLKLLDIHEILESVQKDHGVPALAGAIVYGPDVVAYGAVGVRKAATDVKVTDDDKFHLGSCTKAMTATLIGILVEKNKLDWDSKIAELLPDKILISMNAGYKDVTLRQLLSHRAGLPKHSWPKGMSFADVHNLPGPPAQQRLEYVRRILAQPPQVEPSTKYIYSNAGYSVAGVILEETMDDSWEHLMQTMIFQPCQMNSAGFGAMGSPGKIDQPWQHRLVLGIQLPVEPGPMSDNPPSIGPGGTVHSSMRDWGKFVAVHLTGKCENGKLLKKETLKILHTPIPGQEYALGWAVSERDWAGGKVLNHSGTNNMNYCVAWVAPKKNFAVLAATNVGGDNAFKACDKAVSEMISVINETIDQK